MQIQFKRSFAPFYRQAISEVLQSFQTDLKTGLSSYSVVKRLQETGPNEIGRVGRRHPFRILKDQFVSPMILLLLAVIGISIGIRHFTDAGIISVIVLLNAWIGFFQEFRAEKAMESIRRIAAPVAKVIRNSRLLKIPAREVVPGDVVVLEAGDRIPADLRWAETVSLQVDESLLTGESIPIFKETRPISETGDGGSGESAVGGGRSPDFEPQHPALPMQGGLFDQTNMGFTGTMVVGGRGLGIVVSTGQKTELGRIAALLAVDRKNETPLKQRLEKLTRQLVLAAFFLCFVLFGLGVLRGKPTSQPASNASVEGEAPAALPMEGATRAHIIDMLLAAISLGVAAIPEGLPAVITISLSLGSLRLAKLGALVRRLPAVEGLGSITVICADKTGTLTQNRMTVRYPEGEIQLTPFFLEALILCNDAKVEPLIANEHRPNRALPVGASAESDSTPKSQMGGSGGERDLSPTMIGDPMEVALLNFAKEKHLDPSAVRTQWKRIFEIPFDTDRKRMSTLHEAGNRRLLFIKGAPEKVIALCPSAEQKKLADFQEELAARGLRVIAVAMKEVEPSHSLQDPALLEQDMIFLGFIGLQDPPRKEVPAAIDECRAARIRPVMITGDHQTTAVAIAKELGIYREGDFVITGEDLKGKSREWLDKKIATASVFARVTPEDKLSIIQVLKDLGEIVAMTGDGVNDAPALRRADIGVAMGRGTDVAKEASSLILVEENFSTIVHAVREGRVIYDNIRKFVRYMLTTNLAEIATMLLGVAAGFPTPLLPAQILWINLVTDGLPAVALGYESAEGNVMARRPRPTDETILGRGLWQHVLWVGILMGGLTIGSMGLMMGKEEDLNRLRTVVFTALTLAQMGHVLAIRQEDRPLWRIGLFSNWRLMGAVLITVLSQIALVYLPPLQKIFHTTALSLQVLFFCWIPAIIIFVAVEVEKKVKKIPCYH